MRRICVIGITAGLLACFAGIVDARRAPVRRPTGGGPFGGAAVKDRVQPPDPAQVQAAFQQHLKDLAAQGFKALAEPDAAEAFSAFGDLGQLAPANPDAALGTALAYALKGNWAKCLTYLDTAARNNADAKLVALNRAAALSRDPKAADKAALALYVYMNSHPQQPLDDTVMAAETAMVGKLTDEQRKAMPGLIQSMTTRQQAWAAKSHAGQDRFGLAWLDPADVKKLRDANKAEPFPGELPFILPDGSLLPIKGDDTGPNPLSADVAAGKVKEMLAKLDEPPAPLPVKQPGDDPAVKPTETVKPNPTEVAVKPVDPPVKLPDPVKVPDPEKPITPAAPMHRTSRGAAFAISKDVVVTWDRLVSGGKEITVTATDGMSSKATILVEDAASGLALLKVEGDTFEPLAIADAPGKGPVTVATFPKASVFQPSLETLHGDILAGGKPMLKMASHPRSAGAPVLDAQGRVVAMVAAERDDAPEQLPIIGAEAIARFCKDHVSGKGTKDYGEAVVEIEVTR